MNVVDVDAMGAQPVHRAVLSLGANLGEVDETLQGAVDLLAATPGVLNTTVSPVYVTDPVGRTDQPDFHNIVVILETTISPRTLLERAQALESAYGRQRTVANGPRTLDVDIVAFGQMTLAEPDLVVPHPRAHERAFVLVPWHDVDPDAVLPGHGAIAELLAGVDTSGVRRAETEVVLS